MLVLFLEWYFIEMPPKIKKVWSNYVWFFGRYFALGHLSKDLFAPWKGLTFKRTKRAFEMGDAASAAFGNLMSSVIGAVIRIFFLAIGLAVELAAILAGFLAFLIWLAMFPLIVFLLIKGVMLILS